MKLELFAANNYAAASECIVGLLKKNDPRKLDEHHIVISNDRTSMTSELSILDELGGSFNTRVMTFARLTSCIMKEKTFISKQSAIMLLGKIAEELKTQLKCYTKSFDTAGFAESIYETVSQLKYSAISPDEINPDEYEGNLKLKMQDIKIIYAAYENFIKDSYVDSGAKLNELIKHIPESDLIKNSYFYVKDFDSFSVQEALILRQLVIYSKGVTVALPFVRDNHVYSDENFSTIVNIAKGLDVDCKINFVRKNSSGFTSVIENYLFSYTLPEKPVETHDVTLNKASDVFDEVEKAACHIKKKIASGDRYKDFLVVSSDVTAYTYAVKSVFEKYDIPYFIDDKKPLADHVLARFLCDVMRVKTSGFLTENCFAVMKNVFYETEHDIFAFENFCLKNNVRFLNYPFDVSDEEDSEAERTRSEFVNFANSLDFSSAQSVEDFCAALTAFIKNEKTAATLQKVIDRQETLDHASYKVSLQAEEKLVEVIKTLADLFGNEKTTAEKFFDLFLSGVRAEKISIIPLYNDCVVVTSLAKSRANANKHLVVLGAGDGKFPAVKGDTKLIADGDIESLEKHGVLITPKIESENRREAFNVFQLLSMPRQSLYMSYVSSGESSAPCRAFEEIGQMFVFSSDENVEANVFSKKQAEEKLVEMSSAYMSGEKWLLPYLSTLYKAVGNENITEFLFTDDQKQPLSKGEEVLLPKGKTSVTRLESFFRCPYAYFLEHGLKLKERKEGQLKAVDTGNIIHEVLEKFVKKFVIGKNLDMDESKIAAEAAKLFDECVGKKEYAFLKKDAKLAFAVKSLKEEAKKVCVQIYRQFLNSCFKPEYAEYTFGFDGEGSVIDAYGKQIALVGKIDRIDVFDDKFVIVDYKTGKSEFSEKSVYAGQKLQLLTYVSQAKKLTGKRCAGFFYMPIRNNFSEKGEPKYRYVGRILDDGETIFQLDKEAEERGKSDLLSCSLTKSGKFNAQSSLPLSEEQIDVYLKYTSMLMKSAVKEMTCGFICQNPFGSVCKSCKFSSVCFKNDLSDVDEDSVGKITKQTLWEAVNEEV